MPYYSSTVECTETVLWLKADGCSTKQLLCGCSEGVRPLHLAVEGGHEDLVSWLIERGCNVNEPSFDGTTPLHIACEYGHVTLVSGSVLLRIAARYIAGGTHKSERNPGWGKPSTVTYAASVNIALSEDRHRRFEQNHFWPWRKWVSRTDRGTLVCQVRWSL